ncbi:MAG: substrate-binding periplasmic protein [Oligoflexales bacterium]
MKNLFKNLIFLIFISLISRHALSEVKINFCLIKLELWGEKVRNEYKGINAEILEALAKKANVKSNIIFAPYPRIIKNLSTGVCDLTVTLPDPKAKGIEIGEKYWTIRMGILPQKGFNVSSLNNLSGKRVGELSKATLGPAYDGNNTFKRTKAAKYGNLVRMLKDKKVDAVAGDLDILQKVVTELNFETGSSFVVAPLPLHFMMSQKSKYKNRIQEFNKIIVDLEKTGEISKIVNSYFQKTI